LAPPSVVQPERREVPRAAEIITAESFFTTNSLEKGAKGAKRAKLAIPVCNKGIRLPKSGSGIMVLA